MGVRVNLTPLRLPDNVKVELIIVEKGVKETELGCNLEAISIPISHFTRFRIITLRCFVGKKAYFLRVELVPDLVNSPWLLPVGVV